MPTIRPSDDADGRRPAGAETRGERGLAQILPERVARDLRDHHLPLQEDRGRAGSVARGDPDLADRLEELARQPLTGDVTQVACRLVIGRDGAERVGCDALGGLGDRLERRREVRVARHPLEDPPLADRQQFAALALGDVGDAAANQPAAGRRQPDHADFAGDVVAVRVAVQPLEARRLARECAIDVAARDAERRRPVRLLGRTDPLRSRGEQFLTRHLEEANRVVVAFDEVTGVGVEHDDRFRGVFDQRAITRLAFADRRLGELAVRGVAQADDVDRAPVEPHLAHPDLGVEQGAVAMPAAGLARRQVELRVLDGLGQLVERAGEPRVTRQRGDQQVEPTITDLGLVVTEHAFARRVHGFDAADLVDGQDRILDVIHDRLELGGGVLPYLAGGGRGLVGEQLHRAHDAAALVVPLRVGRADGQQELAHVGRAVVLASLVELLVQEWVHAHRQPRRGATRALR